jgi:hypothetical protein
MHLTVFNVGTRSYQAFTLPALCLTAKLNVAPMQKHASRI